MNPPADIRWQPRLMNFERALRLLREAMAHGPDALNQLEKEGAIQRFEDCFELAWKTVKDYMEASGVVFDVVMPRQVIKDAYAAKVLADGATWMAVFEQAVEAIHQCYLPQLEQLHQFLQQEATP